jgi:hypothetical protein
MLVGAAAKRSTNGPRRRRWPLLVAAVLVLSAGAAGGVLAQRFYGTAEAGQDDEAADDESSTTDDQAAAPASVPDHAARPDPHDKSAIADPFLPRLFGDPDPMDPADPIDPPMDPPLGRRPQARLPKGAPPDVDNFGSALATSLCEKLTTCGVFDGLGGGLGGTDICSLAASSFADPDTAERVRRGECQYDAAAAGQCLDALGDLKCDATTDPSSLLAFADSVSSCTSAVTCNE